MESVAERLELLDLDEHVGRVAAEAARPLVDHDPAVGQRVALALGACRQQHRRHAGGHADADRGHRRAQVLHRVVDGEAGGDHAAGRVDVEVDVLVRVLGLEEEQLGDDQVGDVVLDGVAQEDDALLEQPAVDVVGALAPAAALDDHGHEHGSGLAGRGQHGRTAQRGPRRLPGGGEGRPAGRDRVSGHAGAPSVRLRPAGAGAAGPSSSRCGTGPTSGWAVSQRSISCSTTRERRMVERR